MKSTNISKNIIRSLCVICALALSMSLCSCLMYNPFPSYDYEEDNTNTQNGSLDEWLDGMENGDNSQDKDNSTSQGGNSSGDVNINIEEAEDIRYAAAKGLLSSVIVIGSSRQQGTQSAGSGVIYKIDKELGNALIITNYHVVYDSGNRSNGYIYSTINLYLYGSENSEMAVEAHYVGGSMYYDLAVLYVENSDVIKNCSARAVDLANSDTVRAGQTVMAIGNPENGGVSVSKGIVSVDSEYITMTAVDNRTSISLRVMRIDAAVNSGNSGGGLFDAQGNLIGIVNAKIIESGVESIGYAIPVNVAKAITENILYYCSDGSNKSVMRALIGITVQATSSYARYNEETGLIDVVETIQVTDVSSGSIASGIVREGDVIVSIKVGDNTKAVTRQFHIIDAMLDARPGDSVIVTVNRGGKTMELTLKITQGCLTEY